MPCLGLLPTTKFVLSDILNVAITKYVRIFFTHSINIPLHKTRVPIPRGKRQGNASIDAEVGRFQPPFKKNLITLDPRNIYDVVDV